METPEAAPKQARWGRRALLGFALIITLSLGWHLYLTAGAASRIHSLRSGRAESGHTGEISLNPLTNLISITMPPDVDDGNSHTALGSLLGQALIHGIGPVVIERELNTVAREQYDIYAVLIPYRVRIKQEPANKEAAARPDQAKTEASRDDIQEARGKTEVARDDVFASRVSEADIDKFLSGVKVQFPVPNGPAGVPTVQEAPSGVADGEILDEAAVDRLMRANHRRLVACAMVGGVRSVEIDFVVQPTGRVKAVQVNGQRRGPLAMCILNQMQSFSFPSYKGKNTIASWSMSFR